MFRMSLISLVMMALPIQPVALHQATGSKAHTVNNAVANRPATGMIPENLVMPPNPPAPGRAKADRMGLPHLLAQRTTNYYHASETQAKNIELVSQRLNGIVVAPGGTFSYYKTVGPYTQENGYGWGRAFQGDHIVPSMAGGVCQGSSTLYSALLRTCLPVVERHNHGLTVPYLPAGEDATVAMSVRYDFRFKNNQATPILITSQALPDKRYLTVAIWGAKPAPEIEVRHTILAVYPYKTIHKKTTNATMQKVLFPGQKGATVETFVDIHSTNGVTHRLISKDTYRPSPRIVELPNRAQLGDTSGQSYLHK